MYLDSLVKRLHGPSFLFFFLASAMYVLYYFIIFQVIGQ